jgi:hypothetical protein
VIERVLLMHGPFDGSYLDLESTREYVTVEWVEGSEWREYAGRLIAVPQLGVAGYRRLDRHTFVHCRVQTKLGDRPADLAFPAQQLTLEDLRDDRDT